MGTLATYFCSWVVVSVCSNESTTSDSDQLFCQMLLTFECFQEPKCSGTDQGYAVFILYLFWKHYYFCPLTADTSVYVLCTLHSFRVLRKIIRPPKPALNCILGLQKCFSICLGNWTLRNAFLGSHSSFSVAFLVEYMNIWLCSWLNHTHLFLSSSCSYGLKKILNHVKDLVVHQWVLLCLAAILWFSEYCGVLSCCFHLIVMWNASIPFPLFYCE